MSTVSASKTGSGYLVNLLSNDVSRFDYGFVLANIIWILPFQFVIVCYLLYQRIGWAAVITTIALLLKTVPLQTFLSRISSTLRLRIAGRTDIRVGIMNEIIQGIQVIKMYAWENPFRKVVSEARRLEIQQIKIASYIRVVYVSTMEFTERSTLFILIAACILMEYDLTVDVIFSASQYYNILIVSKTTL